MSVFSIYKILHCSETKFTSRQGKGSVRAGSKVYSQVCTRLERVDKFHKYCILVFYKYCKIKAISTPFIQRTSLWKKQEVFFGTNNTSCLNFEASTAIRQQNVATGRGGRTPKQVEKQVDQVVKTTLTQHDFSKLQAAYKQETVGQKVSFAEYIRRRLMQSARPEKERVSRREALTIQLELAEIRNQLDEQKGPTIATNQTQTDYQSLVNMTNTEEKTSNTDPQLAATLHRLEEIVQQISTWLYGSSPEKI